MRTVDNLSALSWWFLLSSSVNRAVIPPSVHSLLFAISVMSVTYKESISRSAHICFRVMCLLELLITRVLSVVGIYWQVLLTELLSPFASFLKFSVLFSPNIVSRSFVHSFLSLNVPSKEP